MRSRAAFWRCAASSGVMQMRCGSNDPRGFCSSQTSLGLVDAWATTLVPPAGAALLPLAACLGWEAQAPRASVRSRLQARLDLVISAFSPWISGGLAWVELLIK